MTPIRGHITWFWYILTAFVKFGHKMVVGTVWPQEFDKIKKMKYDTDQESYYMISIFFYCDELTYRINLNIRVDFLCDLEKIVKNVIWHLQGAFHTHFNTIYNLPSYHILLATIGFTASYHFLSKKTHTVMKIIYDFNVYLQEFNARNLTKITINS